MRHAIIALRSTHCSMTFSVACHQRLGQHKRSDNVQRGMQSFPLDITYGRMTSDVAGHHCLWAKTHGQTTSGVGCNHIPWTSHTVEKLQVFHAIVVFGLHTRSNDVRHGIPACPLGSKNLKTTSGKAFHHRPLTTNEVRRSRAWHVIIDLEQYTRSDDV